MQALNTGRFSRQFFGEAEGAVVKQGMERFF